MNCRLLYLVGQLGPGGLERQLSYLLQAMDRERYRPAVAVWNFSENDVYVARIRALGVPLYSFPQNLSPGAKLRAFRTLVKELKPEVTHSFTFYTNFAACWAAIGTQTVALGSVRGDFVLEQEGAGPWLGRLSSRWPRSQICNSVSAAGNLSRSHSYFVPRQVSIVHNGLDLERFRYLPGATNGRVYILGVGSLLPVKRWDRLVRAALGLKNRGFNFLIQIAGGGPLRESLEQEAQDLGLAGWVKLIGHADDVPHLLANTTFLAHTSDSEGFPNAVMEAMACGRAVVATDVGDVPSLVEDDETGFVVRSGNDEMLVECMTRLITDRDLCSRMGVAGRAKAEREFGLDRLVSETLAAYKAAGWRG